VADHLDEPGEHRTGEPGQRFLAGVGAADLDGAHAEAVAPLLGQVDDEAGVDQLGEQVVGGRPAWRSVPGRA
jgi:hypothetical protein